MLWWQALIIGLVQGVTEFLPVSSSGHLAVTYQLLGLVEEPVVLSVILHFFTLLAVTVYFRKQILGLKFKQLATLALASIPAALVGLLIKDWISSFFNSLLLIGLLFSLTGLVNMLGDYILTVRNLEKPKNLWSWPNWRQAVLIGLAQAIAILPSVSRSGMTVISGLLVGGKRQSAFNFSFLLSLPAVGGAFLLEMIDSRTEMLTQLSPIILLAGVLAFISGYLSLKLLAIALNKADLKWFGFYTLALSVVIVATQLF